MKEKREDDASIGVSLETLAHHILETPRNDLAALRAAFDRQISSIEARLEASAHQAAIDATGKIIADVIGERVDREQQRAETDLTQALAVNTMLRRALDNAQQQVESAQADLADAEADRKAMAAQHREALNDRKKLAAELTNSQQQVEELESERVELQRKLKDATAAKAVAETQYQQLAAASQKLTDGLSRTLHGQREQARPDCRCATEKNPVSRNQERCECHPIERRAIEECAGCHSGAAESRERSKKTTSILRAGTRCQARQDPPGYPGNCGWDAW